MNPQTDYDEFKPDEINELAGMAQTEETASRGNGSAELSIEGILDLSGVKALTPESSCDDLLGKLQILQAMLKTEKPVKVAVIRDAVIKHLASIGIRAPAAMMNSVLPAPSENADGPTHGLTDPEPWIEEVDGDLLLQEFDNILAKYIVLPGGHCRTALVLWILLTYCLDSFQVSPRILLKSPTRRSGKTRVLEILSCTCRRALVVVFMTGPVLYRLIDQFKPTLLIDEGDAHLRDNEDIRGLLNAGHTRGTIVPRCEGDDNKIRIFRPWCALAVAGIGDLHDTLEDRSIVINMQRRKTDERVEPYSIALRKELEPLTQKALRWANDHGEALASSKPAVPEELNDRAADNWRPLLAIAEVAGGVWPSLARESALKFSSQEQIETATVELLQDMLTVFEEGSATAMATDLICDSLKAMSDRPWSTWGRKGRGINGHMLGRLLRPFGIKPSIWRNGTAVVRGYRIGDFMDATSRYSTFQSATCATAEINQQLAGKTEVQQTRTCNT